MASPEKRKEFLQMLSRYRKGTATEAEKNFVESYLQSIEIQANISDSLSAQDIDALENKIWAAIQQQTNSIAPVVNLHTKDRKLFPWKRIAVAASIVGVLLLATYVISTKEKSQDAVVVSSLQQSDLQAPQTNRAQITLADGTVVYLDSAANGQLATQSNVTVTKTEDGKIIYEGQSLTIHDSPLTYNTLTNPRGSIVMNMTLADGSQVWLNAGSSITYPVAFVGNERKITITGEAYFEIAHNKSKPFIVSANNKADVTVLGTHFNVNAYNDEQEIKVTLLEGSVKVSNDADSKTIKPGQQVAVLSGVEGSPLTIHHSPDLEATMAWKNGTFFFNSTSIEDIMKQVSRWYNVDVVYEGPIPKGTISGEAQRTLSFSQMQKVLQLTDIKFRIEGRKLIVTK